nr:multidrug effflux MFS transporter [Achromobacter xylosoxidans]
MDAVVSRREPLPSFPMMVLMLGLLSCVAPATIDAYLPAFGALGREFAVPQETVQLTLGVYMACYASMLLLHGTLSDSLGRRRVVLAALGVYVCGALMAALAPGFGWLLAGRAVQGLSAGAGIVVGQAIIRDCYDGAVARRAMSYLILVFNLSPALAPILGGYLAAHQGWRSIFLLLTALAAAAWLLCARRLPETLPPDRRQPLAWRTLGGNYARVLGNRRYAALGLAFSLLFAAQGFLIGAAPDFITNVLGLPETDFAYLFVPLVVGAMAGALLAARKAGHVGGAAHGERHHVGNRLLRRPLGGRGRQRPRAQQRSCQQRGQRAATLLVHACLLPSVFYRHGSPAGRPAPGLNGPVLCARRRTCPWWPGRWADTGPGSRRRPAPGW